MAKKTAAQQVSHKAATETPAEQKTNSVTVLGAEPESKGFVPADEPLELPAAEGDSSESPEDAKGDTETQKVDSPSKAKKKPKTGKDLYPEGTKLFAYKPKAAKSDAEILYFPMEFNKPDKVWLWELNQLPFLNQTWAWMDRAEVPKSIQRQCVSLPDDEYPDCFNEWFEAMGGGATPGE